MNQRPRRDQQRAPGGQRSSPSGAPGRVRPVYKDVATLFRPRPPATANTGLAYDRYANIWSGSPGWKPQTPRHGKSVRQQFLDETVEHAHGVAAHAAPLLRSLHERRAVLWKTGGARVVDVVLAGPLVSGVGMTHALEVGFVWDRNLGVPYLPATSLKGAARAWALQWGALDPDAAQRIFGNLTDSGAGTVIFHALYPLRPPTLRVDVLNPHFADYYREGEAPGDWMEPNPVFFLTVPAGERFRAGIQLRPQAALGDLDHAEKCLRDTLATLGAGAKTAVGYGRFRSSATA